MTLELRPPFPRPRPHFPHRPIRRFYGGGYPYVPYYQEPLVLEVERSPVAMPLPWRIVQQVSGGALKVVSQHASMEDAVKAFKEGQARLRKLRPRCSVTFSLQRWTGSAWNTESTWTCPAGGGLGEMRFVKLWRPDGSAAQPLSPGLPPSVVAKMRSDAGWTLRFGADPTDPNNYTQPF